MEARLASDLSQMSQTIESFLAQQKKTLEQIRTEWTEAADKRAKIRLLLAEIARKENIEPKQEDLDHEIENAKQHYPQAESETLRAHIAHAMRNEMVMRFLDGSPETEPHNHEH